MEEWRIIGIDCAVDPANVGVAVGEIIRGRVTIHEAVQCTKSRVADVVCGLAGTWPRVLFAFDAPLGWPQALGEALVGHEAGAAIRMAPHKLFRRRTDEVVKAETNQQPFDVGADRIARTAVASLTLLSDIRAHFDAEIPLGWSVPVNVSSVAIEVYPAATLRQLGLSPRSYKKPEHAANRMALFDALTPAADLSSIRAVAEQHADALFASWRVLTSLEARAERRGSRKQRWRATRDGSGFE